MLAPFLEILGLRLQPEQLALLERHYRALMMWNQRLNLTSVREPEAVVRRHFAESLFVAAHLGVDEGTLADVGSGGGFPGLPIAVVRPGVQVTLVESVAKKAAFLKEASRGLPNVRVVRVRFEEIEETFDWVVLRGVASDPLAPYLRRSARRLGLLMGSKEAEDAVRQLGIRTPQVVALPWEQSRVLVTGSSV